MSGSEDITPVRQFNGIEDDDDDDGYDEKEALKRKEYSSAARRAIAIQRKLDNKKTQSKRPEAPTRKHQPDTVANSAFKKTSLRNWITEHLINLTPVVAEAMRTGLIIDESGARLSSNNKESTGKLLISYRELIVKENLENLSKACIGEAHICAHHLKEMSASSTYRVDVNDVLDAFYEVYDIICYTKPWNNTEIADKKQQELQKQLDDIHKDIDEARQVYIRDSRTESGVSKRGNNSSMLHTLFHQMLVLSDFVDGCTTKPKNQADSWKFKIFGTS